LETKVMRELTAAVLAMALLAPAARADVSLSLWLKRADRADEETICVVARKADGSMTQQVQRLMNSFPARPQPLPESPEATAAFDAVLALIDAGGIQMDEMNPDMPWSPSEGMELRLTRDGTERLARVAGLTLPDEVLALFDSFGDGACTRLADR
jgi:hypothetical protein